MMVLDLDVRTAWAMAQAITVFRGYCRDQGMDLPTGLLEVQRMLLKKVKPGQDGPELDPVSAIGNSAIGPSRLYSIETVADALIVSPRTVRRLITEGALRSIHVGGSVRIRPADFDEYLAAAS
jgi:excisionase family DNA binding protein